MRPDTLGSAAAHARNALHYMALAEKHPVRREYFQRKAVEHMARRDKYLKHHADREFILDKWAEGKLSAGQIALRVGWLKSVVEVAIATARAKGDPRAIYRKKVSPAPAAASVPRTGARPTAAPPG